MLADNGILQDILAMVDKVIDLSSTDDPASFTFDSNVDFESIRDVVLKEQRRHSRTSDRECLNIDGWVEQKSTFIESTNSAVGLSPLIASPNNLGELLTNKLTLISSINQSQQNTVHSQLSTNLAYFGVPEDCIAPIERTISVVGNTLSSTSQHFPLGTGPLLDLSSHNPRDTIELLIKVDSSLLTSSIVNVTSCPWDAEREMSHALSQQVVSSSVTESTNHLSGACCVGMSSKGSLLAQNASFTFCTADVPTFENNQSMTRQELTEAPTLYYFKNCTFRDLSGSLGGAICLNVDASLRVENCTFVSCRVDGNNSAGGAVFASKLGNAETTLTISTSVFQSCLSASIGGAASSWNLSATFNKCVFISCSSSLSGGAIHYRNRTANHNHPILLDACCFINCSSAGTGGCVATQCALLYVTSSSFIKSHAHDGGSLYSSSLTYLTVSDSIFINSTADKAGGAIDLSVNNSFGCISISSTLFQFCQQTDFAGHGGGALCLGNLPFIQLDSVHFRDCFSKANRGHDVSFDGTLDSFHSEAVVHCDSTSKRPNVLIGGSKTVNSTVIPCPSSIARVVSLTSTMLNTTTATLTLTLNVSVSWKVLVVVQKLATPSKDVKTNPPQLLIFTFGSSSYSTAIRSKEGTCVVDLSPDGVLQPPLEEYRVVTVCVPGYDVSVADQLIPLPPIPKITSTTCNLDGSGRYAVVEVAGVLISSGAYSVHLKNSADLSFEIVFTGTSEGSTSVSAAALPLVGSNAMLEYGSNYEVDSVRSLADPDRRIELSDDLAFSVPVPVGLVSGKVGELDEATESSLNVTFHSSGLMGDCSYKLVLTDQSHPSITRTIDLETDALGMLKELTVVLFDSGDGREGLGLQYGHDYKVTSMVESMTQTPVFVVDFVLRMPAEPSRIVNVQCSLADDGQNALVVLIGREVDAGAYNVILDNGVELIVVFNGSQTAERCSQETRVLVVGADKILAFGSVHRVVTVHLVGDSESTVLIDDRFNTFMIPTGPDEPVRVKTISCSNTNSNWTIVTLTGTGFTLKGTYNLSLSGVPKNDLQSSSPHLLTIAVSVSEADATCASSLPLQLYPAAGAILHYGYNYTATRLTNGTGDGIIPRGISFTTIDEIKPSSSNGFALWLIPLLSVVSLIGITIIILLVIVLKHRLQPKKAARTQDETWVMDEKMEDISTYREFSDDDIIHSNKDQSVAMLDSQQNTFGFSDDENGVEMTETTRQENSWLNHIPCPLTKISKYA
ncbi:hypothetical protein BLNAU_15269 [Blattamonas nauphoetae]|uniref:Uncharacterized protein n=1 Tax=Blattamonas nauphoetae TaxID=2049346 RepID=A0ABQ9XEN1_9EUKA|nr:hypothetical protein BLNAU_15269 [Blattamonas nauphoetae]